jgi:hypothetical protein
VKRSNVCQSAAIYDKSGHCWGYSKSREVEKKAGGLGGGMEKAQTGDFLGLKAYDHEFIDSWTGEAEKDAQGNPKPKIRVNELEICFKLAENGFKDLDGQAPPEGLKICFDEEKNASTNRFDNYNDENKVATVVSRDGGWCIASTKAAVIIASFNKKFNTQNITDPAKVTTMPQNSEDCAEILTKMAKYLRE